MTLHSGLVHLYSIVILVIPLITSVSRISFTIIEWHSGHLFSDIKIIICGGIPQAPLNFAVISIGAEARLEPKIKGEGGSSQMQKYR